MQFKDVLVDPSLKARLIGLARENRISHAQLFLAQSGSHAFALATALGQYLCCQNPGEDDSCGVCPSCVQFQKLSHPDLHIFFPNCIAQSVKKDPESELFIQEFRDFVIEHNYHIDLEDWLRRLNAENKQPSINIRDAAKIVDVNSTRSYSGGYKIYILWCADRLYHDAAPKLLKTLEEPETQSLFILISEKPDKILNTIQSRTQLVKIPKLSHEDLLGEIRRCIPEVSDSEANDLVMVADGNLNRALKIHEDDGQQQMMLEGFSTFMQSALNYATRRPLSEVNYDGVQHVVEIITQESRECHKQFMEYMLRMLRNLLLLSSKQTSLIKATHAELQVLDQFKGKFNIKHISGMTQICNKTLHHIGRNVNTGLALTNLYIQCIQQLS